MKKKIFLWLLIIAQLKFFSQQLIINEVSQGPGGGKEYVELLVVGSPTCNSIPCMDLRNFIIDDNNGNHATGVGTGIAAGCVRLKNVPFWQCIPYGTIILIYNDADLNASVPPADLLMTDGNCKLVIPISDCNLFEKHTTQPSTTSALYPTAAYTNCGSWGNISMANSDDSFQIISPGGALAHSVSWGNNTLSPIIYFAGAAGGMVCVMTNALNNNPFDQANYVMVPISGNETPGSPNNAANSAWINSMNNGCVPLSPFTGTVAFNNAGCTCNGTATFAATGAIAPYTYTWFPSGGNASVASGLCSGIYTVSSTSSNGCTQSHTINILSVGSLSASIANTSISCNGLSTGSSTVTTLGGTAPFSYTWSPVGGNSSIASGLSPGTYTALVKDAANCILTLTTTITQPTALSAITTASNVSCNAGSNGSATVSTSGGTAGYTYNWLPSGGTSSVAIGLTAGSYTANITDANNCTLTAVANVLQPTALSALTTASNVSCNAGSNGSATVSASGGTAGYTYNWLPAGGTSSVAIGLTAGSYTANITDANNCTLTAVANVLQPTALSALTTASNVSCNAGSNGSATITVSGGTAGYSYNWLPSGGTSVIAVALTAGSYTANITDANNCTLTAIVNILQPTALSAITTASNVSCNAGSNGSATVTVSGGTAGYSYNWLPSGGTSVIAVALTAGSYTANITDANNCTLTAIVNILQPTALSAITTASNVSCNAGSNGSATVSTSGGTAGYTYNWLPAGGTSSVAIGLTAGSYTANITDANNCTLTAVANILQPTVLSAITTASNVSCNAGSNGSATVSTSGGTAGYTYNWLPSGGTSSVAIGLTAGSYTANITDANNCTLTAIVNILQPPALSAITTASNVSCNAGSNGSATISTSGGTAGYTYNWLPSGGTSSVAIGLTGGSYTANITDANNCTLTAVANILQPTAIVTTVNSTNANCGMANGSATITASGGTPSYTYNWLPAGGTSSTAAGLSTGNHTAIVTDSKGCTLTTVAIINQTNSMNISITSSNVICNGGTNGSANISVSGGTAPYNFTWSPTPFAGQGTGTVSGLTVQSYTASIQDAAGCITNTTIVISGPPALIALTTASNVSCNAGSNGSATVSASGGTTGYTYNWLPSGGTSSIAVGLTAGSYTANITDANNCTITAVANVLQPPALSAITTASNVSCNAGSNGNVTITVTGGNPGYSYNWLPSGGTASTAIGLTAGSYTANITDANNCTIIAVANILQPTALSAITTVSNVSCNTGSNGSATVTTSGGTAGYTYNWLPSGGTSSVAVGLTAGSYTVLVTDANLCTKSISSTITQPSALNVFVNPIKLCAEITGTLTANATGGTAPYTYFWNNLPGNSTLSVNPAGTTIYSLSVIDNKGCASTLDTALVTIPLPLNLTVSPSYTLCPPLTKTLSAIGSGGNGNYQYTWIPGNLTGSIISVNVSNSITYTVTISDGCSLPVQKTINIVTEVVNTPTLYANKLSGCAPLCVTFTNSAFNQLNPQQILWSFGDGSFSAFPQPQHCYINDGIYTIYNTFTTTAGCIITNTFTNKISVYKKPVAAFSSDRESVNYTEPLVNFNNESEGATNYFWDFGNKATSIITHPSHNFNEPGKYLVTLVSSNGLCTDTAFKLIECLPVFTFYAPNVFTPNGDRLNDVFLPKGEGWDIKTFNLMIFDRWGEKLFATREYSEGWNAQYKGEPVKDDTYIWKITLKDIFGMQHKYVGHVTVIK